MRDLIVTALVFGSIPFILRNAYIGILVWSWLSYMNPHRLAWGFAYDFPFAQLIAIVTMVAILFSREPKSFPLRPVTVVWLVFVGWMLVTTLFALFPVPAMEQLIKVLKIQFVTLLTLVLINNEQRLKLLILVIVVSIGFFGVKGGLFTILGGGENRVYGPAGSFIAENNALALATLMTIPLMEYLRRQTQQRWVKLGLVGAMILCAASVLGSHSRGAVLAGAVLFVLYAMKSRHKLLTILVATLAVTPLVFLMPQEWEQRIATITDSGKADVASIASMEARGGRGHLSAPIASRDWLGYWPNDFSALGRVNAWNYAINVANARVTGAGFESWEPSTFLLYAPIVEEVQSSHSVIFGILADHGWIGLMLFSLIYLLAWRNAGWVIARCRNHSALGWAVDLMAMTRLSIVAFFVGGAFLSLAYFDLPWHLVTVTLICRLLVEGRLKSSAAQTAQAAQGHIAPAIGSAGPGTSGMPAGGRGGVRG